MKLQSPEIRAGLEIVVLYLASLDVANVLVDNIDD